MSTRRITQIIVNPEVKLGRFVLASQAIVNAEVKLPKFILVSQVTANVEVDIYEDVPVVGKTTFSYILADGSETVRIIKAGATSQTIYLEVLSNSKGDRRTGLAFNTNNLTAHYIRSGGTVTQITLATLATPDAAWSSGGFKEVDATNAPGIYRLDIPDAAIATGVPSVAVTLKNAANMIQTSAEIQLTAIDLQNATSGGLSNLDAAVSTRLASASYTTPPTANENADAFLKRDWTQVTGEAARSVLNALRKLRNKVSFNGTDTLTVTKEDDSTTAYTQPVVEDENQDPFKSVG